MSRTTLRRSPDVFEAVRRAGLALPGVEAGTRYDGSPVLKVAGCFMAGLARHGSAEPGTLVVRSEFEERDRLIEDAPDTYYVSDYYEKYPVVLVRLSHMNRDALRDVLSVSWRLTLPKAGRARKRKPAPAAMRTCGRANPPFGKLRAS